MTDIGGGYVWEMQERPYEYSSTPMAILSLRMILTSLCVAWTATHTVGLAGCTLSIQTGDNKGLLFSKTAA